MDKYTVDVLRKEILAEYPNAVIRMWFDAATGAYSLAVAEDASCGFQRFESAESFYAWVRGEGAWSSLES